jgi:hypothetical protein
VISDFFQDILPVLTSDAHERQYSVCDHGQNEIAMPFAFPDQTVCPETFLLSQCPDPERFSRYGLLAVSRLSIQAEQAIKRRPLCY